jgi:hypothetical protein
MGKRTKIFIGLCLVVILSSIIYLFYYPKNGTAFPSESELTSIINSTHPNARIKQIQDVIQVDDHHYFVPFLSKDGEYCTSYWEWQANKWKVLNIDTSGEPKVWKIDKNDPSTYHFIWNLHVDDKISDVKFYLYRDRNYHITDGIENYFPKIQMEKSLSVKEVSYGVEKISRDWTTVIDSFEKLESSTIPSYMDEFDVNRYVYFAWTPYEQSGIEAKTMYSVGGHSFTNDDIELDFVRYMDKRDLESQ